MLIRGRPGEFEALALVTDRSDNISERERKSISLSVKTQMHKTR